MRKFIIFILSFMIVFNKRDEYYKTYNYSNESILDKDITWVNKIEKEEILEIDNDKEVIKQEIIENKILDVFNGRMSGYGPDCVGCSGYLAYRGIDVRNGNIYYDDLDYGRVRIVAADRGIPFGSIVEVNDSFLVIVLDRGGAIGFGKRFQFDLLFENEQVANANGILVDAKFEVLRYGF